MIFSEADLKLIKDKGLSTKKVLSQLEIFKSGIPYTNIKAPATPGDGIIVLTNKEENDLINHFENKKDKLKLIKFVPASGAATRMFKFLFQFLNNYNPKKESLNAYINKNQLKDLRIFMIGLEKFPFYQTVIDAIESKGFTFSALHINEKIWHVAKTILGTDTLNYGNYPKGLLPFHKYKNNHISTAFEEHLYEAALYSAVNNKADLHFTISEKYAHKFDEEFSRIESYVEERTGVSFNISFSYQQESTDTIAVTNNNEPFRDNESQLLFRPSGHGALLKNLNQLDADIIFIKNIDNVVVKQYKDTIAKHKKILAGKLLQLQHQSFSYLHMLDNETLSEKQLHTIAEFLVNVMQVRISEEFEKYAHDYKIEYLKQKLNRPIRVCGMVKNEGEPGGGPFWVKDESGKTSLQIVESAQINLEDSYQMKKFKNATHFNPVDMVCGVKNYKGEKFNLEEFVDHKAAFITHKTKFGKPIKALELPGLWNGSMAHWNTIFIEVPIITFNPVKTVNDLLKAPHQLKK